MPRLPANPHALRAQARQSIACLPALQLHRRWAGSLTRLLSELRPPFNHPATLAGTFARSEVVADAARLQGVRTSHGSWLNGVKRDDKVKAGGRGGGGGAVTDARGALCC